MNAQLLLGDRYAALGLRAAAAAAYERAGAHEPTSAEAPRRLAELALASGDGRRARRFAEEALRRGPGAPARLLVAQALAAAGELPAARFAFTTVIDGGGLDATRRAAAYLGRAEVAAREGDHSGAAAHLGAAQGELLGPRAARSIGAEEARLTDEIATRAVAIGRAQDFLDAAQEIGGAAPGPQHELAVAALLAAGQAHGVAGIADAAIEGALERALALDPASRALRIRLALRLSRRRYRDSAARARAITILEALAAEPADTPEVAVEQARVWFLLAGLYEDDPEARGAAEDAYRRGLRLRPRHAAAANNLALLALHGGDPVRARIELARALRADPTSDVAWINAARLLDAARPAASFTEDVAAWLDAAAPGIGSLAGPAAARLARAAAECSTQSVLEALYAKGHRLKNLLGIAGARVRSARRAAATGGAELDARLAELERDVGALYDEWAAHLRTLQAEGPRLEIVPVNPLVSEVVTSATQDGRPKVSFAPGAPLPDLRADRALLREALLNLVVNALDAQEAAGERERPVEIVTRAVASTGAHAPAVAIDIRDRGGGIARADIAKIFAPGFTTKPQGSGLGLAVANRVVAAHHGRILVDSELDRGTTMTVLLPSDLGGFSTLATPASRAEP